MLQRAFDPTYSPAKENNTPPLLVVLTVLGMAIAGLVIGTWLSLVL